MPAPKRALVTGVDGFTGHYIVAELEAAGFEVFGIGHHASALPNYRQVDISASDALRQVVAETRPHAVLHLAGIAFVGNASASAFYEVNTIGSRNLLAAIAAEAPQVECVLLASSANVYGNATGGMLNEDAVPSPANDYAISKLAMEHIARLWFDKLPIVIARPFNYTGVGQSTDFLLPKIIDHFKRKASVIELGNLDVFRDFSDVRAVANAYLRLILTRPVGETFNVCSGKTHSIRDVIEKVSTIAGYGIEVKVNPLFVRENEVRSLGGSADKLRSIIGSWSSPEISETLEWMFRASTS